MSEIISNYDTVSDYDKEELVPVRARVAAELAARATEEVDPWQEQGRNPARYDDLSDL